MANKMLIDATHPEETRVVVLRGNRVEEFDFETAHRKQLRGNIYLAKVTRVEPSLQAAFVEYGGNRHGFLAFSEIHPDYYQIPVADRQALIAEDERVQRAADDDDEKRGGRRHERHRRRDHRRNERPDETIRSEDVLAAEEAAREAGEAVLGEPLPTDTAQEQPKQGGIDLDLVDPRQDLQFDAPPQDAAHVSADGVRTGDVAIPEAISSDVSPLLPSEASHIPPEDASSLLPADAPPMPNGTGELVAVEESAEEEVVESVGGADALEEVPDRAPRYRRQYKIQEVIKRRQVLLVQVVKEERGTKGAALTTYLSLAGRYCVLMPNTARGGGISRKITSAEDRKRLREIADELEVPEGMGVILRTAGANRSNAEVRRDFEYLLRQWELVRDLTLKSTAPTLVYEEGSLIKRSIRDLYGKDIDEISVAGEAGYTEAKEFMRMLMPGHAKNVQLYRESQPIFTRNGIESQLDVMFSPVVQLKSGGYIVLNQTEALVSIDVNSGRSTREHHIEDTALKTNIEASQEIARQLRLRDLAGLIVIDYIDMDEKRNNRTVERSLKESLKNDRARIQVGRISHFGLLEMSRQRIRTSVLESSTEKCPHCGGTGHLRSVSSVALQLLRSLEETILKGATHNLIVRTRPEIALYLLNQKRAHLRALEERFHITITVNSDAQIGGQTAFAIDRGEQVMTIDQAKVLLAQAEANIPPMPEQEEEPEVIVEDEEEPFQELDEAMPQENGGPQPSHHEGDHEDGGARRRGRRRRRRGRGGEREPGQFRPEPGPDSGQGHGQPLGQQDDIEPGNVPAPGNFAPQSQQPGEDRGETRGDANGDGEQRRRRRGRRGGRRNRRNRENFSDQPGEQRGEQFRPQQSETTEQPFEAQEPARPVDAAMIPAQRPHIAERMPEVSMAPAATPPSEPEQLRRRSTVREPAPTVARFAPEPPRPNPAPSEEPAASRSAETEDAAKPRRTGWWAKRLLGGKD